MIKMSKMLRDEKGVALIVALGVFVVISILGVAALTVAQGSISETVWDRSSNQAFGVAEAGFNQAVFKARQKSLAAGAFTTTLRDGQARIAVTGAAGMFTVKSTGAVPNLAAAQARRRAVEGRITVLNPYDMIFANGSDEEGGGITIEGNAVIYGPVYARDLLKMKGTGAGGKIVDGPLYIKDNPGTPSPTGDLDISGNAQVGTAANPITAFIDGNSSVTGNAKLYTSAVYSNVPDLVMPSVTATDMPSYRAKANVVIDKAGDTVTNGNYNYPTASGGLVLDGNTADTNWISGGYYLKWDRSADKKSATLQINGTIFVDGGVTIGSNANNDLDITFSGNGTIVANGKISIESNFTPAGGASTFPSTNLVGFVTWDEAEVEPKAGKTVYATVYANREFEIEKACTFYGSGMSNEMEIEENPQIHVVTNISAYLPAGMPPVQTLTSLTSWREVRP